MVRCDTGGPLTALNFNVFGTSTTNLSALCADLESVNDQRVWRCTSFVTNTNHMIQSTNFGTGVYYAAYVQPVNVCDRQRNSTVVSDLRNCGDAAMAASVGVYTTGTHWFGQTWALDPVARTYRAVYESCGAYVPVNATATPIFYQGGLDIGSAVMWFEPTSLMGNTKLAFATEANLNNYRLTSTPLNVSMAFVVPPASSTYETLSDTRPRFLVGIYQSLDSNGLYVSFQFNAQTTISATNAQIYLFATDINATENVLSYATLVGTNSYFVRGWTSYRSDLWGYAEASGNFVARGYLYLYSERVNATATPIVIQSVSFRSPSVLRLSLSNQQALLAFQTNHLNYSCGSIDASYQIISTSVVELTVTGGLCAGAYLYARANLTWSNSEWFSEDQNITVVDGNLRLFNATLFNRDLGYLLDTLDLEFTPAEEFILSANVSLIDLECDGQRADLVFLGSTELGTARFNVSGCNPDVADPVVSLLSVSAVTTATRGSQEEADFPVSAPWFPRLTNDFCTTGNLLILQFDYPVVPLETSPLVVTSDCLKATPIVARGVTDSRIFLKLAAPDTCTISFGIVTDVPARVNVYGDWCQPFAQSLPVGVESVYLMGTERLIVKLNRTFASIAELDASITNPESYYVACPAPSLYQSRVSRLIDYSSDTLRFAVEGCTNQTDATFITTSSYSSQSYLPAIPTLQASVAETVSCVEQGSTVVSARVSGEWELVGGGVTLNSPCQVASVEAWDHDLVFEVSNVTEKEQCVLIANVSLLSVPGFYETIVFPLEACVYSNRLRPSGTFGGMNPDGQVFFVAVVTFGLSAGLVLALAFLYPVCCLSKPRPRGQ